MTPEQALSFIHGRARFGWKPGLDRIDALLRRMGNPEKKLHYVHVAGTKGKGSTCAMTASILQEAGYTVGLYTSPYLLSFYERMRVNGVCIDPQELADRVERLIPLVEEQDREGIMLSPTEFEIVTALAFQYFLDHGCDIVVLEVGLGGRLDSTNAIPAPEVAAITSMSFDHTDILGHTIEAITGEKCGILKPGCQAVTCLGQNTKALSVILDRCRELDISLTLPNGGLLAIQEMNLDGSRFLYDGMSVTLPLAGAVQIQNAVTAIHICQLLKIPESAIVDGLQKVQFPGRFEIISRQPLCIVDGAHNPDSCEKLSVSLDALLPQTRKIIIMGMLGDKDYAVCIANLAQRADIFIAVPPVSPRALTTEQIAACAEPYCKQVLRCETPQDAMKLALSLADENTCIMGCGSLFLIGELRSALLG